MNLSEGHSLYGKTMTQKALQKIILKSKAFRPELMKMLETGKLSVAIFFFILPRRRRTV